MLEKLPDRVKSLPFSIYFDNLSNGMSLFNEWKRDYDGMGTMIENILPRNCPIEDNKQLKKIFEVYLTMNWMKTTE